MPNVFVADGAAFLIGDPISDFTAEKTLIVMNNVKIVNASVDGIIFSKGFSSNTQTSVSIEFNQNGMSQRFRGGFIGGPSYTSDMGLLGLEEIDNVKFAVEFVLSANEHRYYIDDVLVFTDTSDTFNVSTGYVNAAKMRIGGRGADNDETTVDVRDLANSIKVGDIQVYEDDVLVANYVMPAPTDNPLVVTETEQGKSMTLVNGSSANFEPAPLPPGAVLSQAAQFYERDQSTLIGTASGLNNAASSYTLASTPADGVVTFKMNDNDIPVVLTPNGADLDITLPPEDDHFKNGIIPMDITIDGNAVTFANGGADEGFAVDGWSLGSLVVRPGNNKESVDVDSPTIVSPSVFQDYAQDPRFPFLDYQIEYLQTTSVSSNRPVVAQDGSVQVYSYYTATYTTDHPAGDNFTFAFRDDEGTIVENDTFILGVPATILIPDQTIIEDAAYTFDVSGFFNNEPTAYALVNSAGFAIDNAGVISGAGFGEVGSKTINITATNSQGTSEQNSVDFTVNPIPDSIPDDVEFDTLTDAAPNSLVVSSIETVTGINQPVQVASVNPAVEFSINGGAFTTNPPDIENNQTIQLKTTSAGLDQQVTVDVSIGVEEASWTVVSEVSDIEIDPIVFNTQVNVERNTVVESNSQTISGINQPSPISILSGEYSLNAGAWTSASGNVVDGDIIQLRTTSSAVKNVATQALVTIGSQDFEFEVVTENRDETFDEISFEDSLDNFIDVVVESNEVLISGIDTPIQADAVGAEISVNGAAYVTGPVILNNEDTLKLRVTTPNDFEQQLTVTLSTAEQSFDWLVTTGPKSKFEFTSIDEEYSFELL